jgi:hypothetical protein
MKKLVALLIACSLAAAGGRAFAEDDPAGSAPQGVGAADETAQDAAADAAAGEPEELPPLEDQPSVGQEIDDDIDRFERDIRRRQEERRRWLDEESQGDAQAGEMDDDWRQRLEGREDAWRYRRHNGLWWYWLPSERWVVWIDGAWVDYEPGMLSPGGRYFRYGQPRARVRVYIGDGGYYGDYYPYGYRWGGYDPYYGPRFRFDFEDFDRDDFDRDDFDGDDFDRDDFDGDDFDRDDFDRDDFDRDDFDGDDDD